MSKIKTSASATPFVPLPFVDDFLLARLLRRIAAKGLARRGLGSKTLPKSIELDDLVSAGLFGLMDAIRGFDPDRNIKFKTYCTTRIRGSILDAASGNASLVLPTPGAGGQAIRANGPVVISAT